VCPKISTCRHQGTWVTTLRARARVRVRACLPPQVCPKISTCRHQGTWVTTPRARAGPQSCLEDLMRCRLHSRCATGAVQANMGLTGSWSTAQHACPGASLFEHVYWTPNTLWMHTHPPDCTGAWTDVCTNLHAYAHTLWTCSIRDNNRNEAPWQLQSSILNCRVLNLVGNQAEKQLAMCRVAVACPRHHAKHKHTALKRTFVYQ